MTPTVKVPQAMNVKAKKTIFYEDALSEIYSGDCREVLREMLENSVNCVVAKELGRRSIGIDLSEAHCKMAAYRIERTNASLFPMAEEMIKEV